MIDHRKCPVCGKDSLKYYGFSIDENCYLECSKCGFTLEISVPWGDIESEKEHDNLCKEALVKMLEYYHTNKEHIDCN